MAGKASSEDPLTQAIKAEWQRDDIPAAVMSAARAIAKRFEGHVDGVLFYGSCLRTGEYQDRILDFYVIVDRYRPAYGKHWLALANELIPPNVFYHEMAVAGPETGDAITVRSKYAVLSRANFARLVSTRVVNVSVWARFSQPAILLLPRDEQTKARLATQVSDAVTTMIANVRPLLTFGASSSELWTTAFTNTYRAELRSERGDKGQEIYQLDQVRYDRLTPLVLARLGVAVEHPPKIQPPRRHRLMGHMMWALRRLNGKFFSLLRLIKASVTFDGGMDYLAWKISRHSGVPVEIKPWMRKIPIIGAPYLALSLRFKGAFR